MRKILFVFAFLLLGLGSSQAQVVWGGSAETAPSIAPVYYDTVYIHKQARKYGLDPVKIKKPAIYQAFTEWIGMPYRLGGNNIFGIDCSRFVALIYEQAFNVKITGSSRDLFRKVVPVSISDLQEGDLLFFARKGGIFHVGMYLSDGKFIHASTSEGVKISDLKEPYYKRYFYRAGRFLGLSDDPSAANEPR